MGSNLCPIIACDGEYRFSMMPAQSSGIIDWFKWLMVIAFLKVLTVFTDFDLVARLYGVHLTFDID